ncbi:CHAP domain-containing protein [Echinicola strongylocentroti]|uniref:CHAP domain-containing protein n=2 Tax=Echinicola strongylocentroti TaxID=1795355 RepID=A0A2Z4IQT8_9BACT|nr:CHAP domain-containing protein [Echinicola strongylocentroti]
MTDTLSIRHQVTATFLEEVGQLEVGKNNHGPAIKKYLASVGLGEGYAWCAAFVKWVLSENGLPASGANAWSPSWFPASRVIYQRNSEAKGNPQSGDVFGIYFSTKKRIAHVGFIHEWTEKYAVTVEGNTNDAGSREGDGVYRKKRLKRQIYAVADWITH